MIRLQHTQTTSLQQKLAPQLIQSLRLLQMPTLELEQLIQQELEMNPLLEIDEDARRDRIWVVRESLQTLTLKLHIGPYLASERRSTFTLPDRGADSI